MNSVQQEQRVIENVPADHREVVMTDHASELRLSPTVIHALQHWATVQPASNAYTFLSGDDHVERLSYGELHGAVFGLAAYLRRTYARGERIILVMGPGLHYVVGFLACAAAGVVAAPLYPPASEKDWDKLRAVVRDCQPRALLVSHAVEASHGPQLAELPECSRLMIEDLLAAHAVAPADLAPPEVSPDDLAFLQYTSGSTGDPKGVMVSHRNIVHNNRMVATAMGNDITSVFVTWLPLHHDMGMIGMVMQSLSLGARAVLMSPKAFVRDPAIWLRAVSAYRGTVAGAPNFAYDLCVEKVSDEVIDTLDLSSWRVAFNGAEPIKASTLERFYRRFERAGFRREGGFPCYGLAEATLFVAGGPHSTVATTFDVDRDAVHRGKVVPASASASAGEGAGDATRVHTYVGMAIDPRDQLVKIVDPDTWTTLPELRIGELWLKSDSVTRGYWNRPKATADAFHAYTTDTGEGPFLRTGDLGFVHDGKLFITGRIKELIIVNGFNHYPQDIEETVQGLSENFRVHYGAAFSFEDDRLAVIQAVTRGKDVSAQFEDLVSRIRRAVLKAHGVAPAYIGLVTPGTIPKTSSGKIQRAELRRQLLEKRLPILHAWEIERPRVEPRPTSRAAAEPVRPAHPPARGPAAGPAAGPSAGPSAGPATALPASPAAFRAAAVDQKLAWIRTYCATRINSYLIDERRTLPPYVVLDFGNQGLLGMQIPPAQGGLGFSTREFLKVMELLGSKDMTLALFVGLNNVLGVRPVLQFGTQRLKERYLPLLARGRELAAFALTEPAAGSNPQAIEATARTYGDAHRVSGTKAWSGSAAWSGLMNVFAKNVDEHGRASGISAFAVPQTSPGVQQGPEALTMGMRGMIQNTVFLENVEVQPWQVLGQIGHGMTVAQDALCYGRLAIAATCLGATKLCVQLMLQYAGRRRVATGSLLQNPYTRAVLTEVRHQIAGIEALIDGVAERIDAGIEVSPEVLAVCKSVSTEVLWTTVDRTMQLAGGRGYIETNFIPQLFRDARIFRIFEGPTETLNHFVGASALRGRPALRAHLREALDDDTVGVHYDAVVRRIAAVHAPGERDAAMDDWQYLALGEYLNHLVLYGAACGRSTAPATRRWLFDRLEGARAKLEGSAHTFAGIEDAEALRAFGDTIDRELGRREQDAAMPSTSPDALFADAPAKTGPAASGRRTYTPPRGLPRAIRHTEHPPLSGSPSAMGDLAAGSATQIEISPESTAETKAEIEAFLSQWIARRCAQPVASIGADVEFAMLGMGSVDSIDLSAALSEKYALTLDPTVLWNYPNIRELASFVLGKLTRRSGSAAAE
jgi:acyl-CoA synthetase (AMP-forming)/AMP-acid ligase II/alkylation response protein AidB-like acyl-CoA dehydrogenase/acyl carrier protein